MIQAEGFRFSLMYNTYVRSLIGNWLYQAPWRAFFRWRIYVPLPVNLLTLSRLHNVGEACMFLGDGPTMRLGSEHGWSTRTRTTLSHEDENESILIIRVSSSCTSRQPVRKSIIVGKRVCESVDGSRVGGGYKGGRIVHAWVIDVEWFVVIQERQRAKKEEFPHRM